MFLISICCLRFSLEAVHSPPGWGLYAGVVFSPPQYPGVCGGAVNLYTALTWMLGVTLQLLPAIAFQVAWPHSALSARRVPAPPPGLLQQLSPRTGPRESTSPAAPAWHRSSTREVKDKQASSTSPWRLWLCIFCIIQGCGQSPAAGVFGWRDSASQIQSNWYHNRLEYYTGN